MHHIFTTQVFLSLLINSYTEEFQCFLRTPTSNIKDTLNKLPPETFKDIVTKYRDAF